MACLTFGNSDSGRDSDSDKENDEDSNDDSGANVIGVALLSIVQALFFKFHSFLNNENYVFASHTLMVT